MSMTLRTSRLRTRLAAADGMAVRFAGRVSWIAAEKMVVATDDSGVAATSIQRLD